ncbi:MAG: GAF domain-containing protein [Gemmatimonadales bacterium]|nr:GAF domain-containing protein [Gemmatimonadales bacterium]MDQ3426521.1 ATP-binding protein [Gemmatimonadota bacterium]
MSRRLAEVAGVAGTVIVVLTAWRREWELPLHAVGATLLAVIAWLADDRLWGIAALAVLAVSASFWVALSRGQRRLQDSEAKTEQLATQLDRRISELFSLQELSYVLSESIQLDRIVDQVARYAGRFLQTDGAIVVLADDEEGKLLRVVAATGSLEPLLGRVTEESDAALVRFAINRERIEVAQGVATPTVSLIGGLTVRSAAVAPLRSQGVTMGALAVADRQGGPFTTEDLWLLSTVATNASVVLANSRLYEMVRRSKEEWETAFNALTEGIAVVGPGGAMLRANRALAALAEVKETELVGRNFCETLFGTSEAVDELIEAADRGERTAPLVVRLERSQRVLRLTASPLTERADAAHPFGRAPVVVLVEDVTEQRLMESQLIQNDKMASIGQLVSGVAHELNNPLTSIAGLTELLLERDPHPELPREHLRVIHDQAERAGRIVRNLLTFARKGVAEKAAVDLNDVASRTGLLIMYELQLHRVELDWRPSAEPVVVLGDRYELQQVLLNLVTNAVQAVSALPPGRPRRIRLETARHEGEAILRVRDTGPGVPPHLASYLFTPFFTTKGPGEGTGLGLSLSYGLVKAHGGDLVYEAPPEGGAEFRVTLPFYDEIPEQAKKPVAARAEEPVTSHRILVVDDDPAVHRLVSALFTPDGHAVEVARSGEQGLRMLRERQFDLVIADARVPVGAAELFVHALSAACPDIYPRLILGSRGESGFPEPLPDGGIRCVAKPFNLRDLHALALEVFANNLPHSPVATGGH